LNKINKVIFFFGIVVILALFSNSFQTDNEPNVENNSDKQNVILESEKNFIIQPKPKSSGNWEVSYIHINNDNWSATELDYIQNRTGTPVNPHIIENVTIDAGGSLDGILIENSNEYFIIRNCTVYNAGEDYAGILLQNVTNGQILNSNSSNNPLTGIMIFDCNNITISNNTLMSNAMQGIYLNNSFYNVISGNNLTNHEDAISLMNSNENNVTKNNINYTTNNGISISYSYNNTFMENNMTESGFFIAVTTEWTVEQTTSNVIDTTNLVNGKTVYYYVTETNLRPSDFTIPGQIFLINCSDSIISNINITNTPIGISLFSCDNVSVSSNNISGGFIGIGAMLNNDLNISGNNMNNNQYGINIIFTNNSNILGNNFYDNLQYGIALGNSNNVNITENNIYNNDEYGISLINSNFTTISENNITENTIDGIFVNNGENVSINDNRVISNNRGINIEYSFNNTVKNNYVYNNTATGIQIYQSHNHSFIENEVYDNEYGILVNTSNYAIVRDNIANGNDQGIRLTNAYYTEVKYNTANDNYEIGIALINSDFNNISYNNANNNGKTGTHTFEFGIHLQNSDFNNISNNIVRNTASNGINLWSSTFNNITDNTVYNSYYFGIKFEPGSNYNTVTRNILIENAVGIYGEPGATNNYIYDNYIQDRSYGGPGDDGDDDGDDDELSSIFSGQYLILLPLLIIPLAIMGLIAGKTVGDIYNRSKLRKEVGADESLIGVPKIAKTLDRRKNELTYMEKHLNEIEAQRASRMAQLQTEIERNEKRLMEERLKQRLELQEEYYTAFNTLEDLKNELGAEISRRTELEQDITDLEMKKQNIENSMTQLQLEHETNLRQIREQTRIEEQEWAQRRAKMKQDIELEWQNKIREIEEERRLAQNDLENQIKVEEERRIQLQKKSSLNEERVKIVEALKELEEGLLNNIETSYPDINTTPEIVSLNALILTEIGNVLSLLASQRNKENISDGIISKLSRIDAHIRSLTSKMEMQRAAPVLTLPPFRRKGRFSVFNEIEFLCELCHKSMLTVEVKERRLWVKWALLGAKSIMNLSKLGFLVDVIAKKPSMELKKDEFADEFKEGRLTDLVNEIQQGGLDLSEDLLSFATEIQEESGIEVRKMGGYEEIIVKFNRYFNDVIKKGYTFEELLNIYSSKEKVLWQLFSQDEQETIRTFLKDSGNPTLYTADLQLRHGLFVCDECRTWVDSLEEKQNKSGGEPNLGK